MPNYLIDTHSLIWYINSDKNITRKAVNCIENSESLSFVSIVSFWEIAVKISMGKLAITVSFDELFALSEKYSFIILPVTFQHTKILTSLPLIHKDPFDRMIIAQAIEEKLVIITKDNDIPDYPVKTTW
jgi:PIN domain nuclease of toxin-antitoxin system